MNTFESQDKIIIRRRAFSRGLRLTINRHNQIVVTAPLLCPLSVIHTFVAQHTDWIQHHRRTPTLVFTDKMAFSLLGQEVHILHLPSGHQVTSLSNDTLLVSGDISFLDRRVRTFIQKQTLSYITQKAHKMATLLGVQIHHIHLKDTTSRWGSCSNQGNLNFCWRLGLAPLFVLDYIIAHEVAHLKELNHSPAFWRVVAQLTDQRSEAEIWLRRNGKNLY